MTDIATLTKLGYTIFNVNKQKAPVHNGVRMMGWNKMPHDELTKKLDINSNMFGMRMGIQGNGKHILSLDFDCCKKMEDGTGYIYCGSTEALFYDYLSFAGSKTYDGVFDSSTQCNRNVLIDYSNCPKLISIIQELDTAKITLMGLEVLLGGNQVIPPTMTKCKIRNRFEDQRKFQSERPFYVMENDEDNIMGFLNRMINNKYIMKGKRKKKEEKVKPKSKGKEKSDEVYESSDNDILEKICELIDVEYIDDRKTWLSILFAMKKCNMSIEFAKLISSKSSKYDEAAFDVAWNSYNEEQITSAEGTLRYYAKESDEEEYELLMRSIKANNHYTNLLKSRSDYDFACLFVALIGDDLMYQPLTDKDDEKVYLYHEGAWKEDFKPHYLTKKMIYKVVSKFTIQKNIDFNKTLLATDEEENETEYEKLEKKVKGGNWVMEMVKKVLVKDIIVKGVKEVLAGTENKIEFDKNPDLFSFNNKCFDLRTGMEHIPTKHDYILMRTGNDYKKPTKEQMDKIKELVEMVLPDPEVRKTYMSILRTALRGQTLEKFTMANGSGRNGKTFLHELMFKFMGNYAIKGNVSIITQKMKSGPNPELANLNKKRFVLWAEPEENQSIQISTMKDLTGGDTITAKQCHSNKTEQINHGTHVMELNERVGFDGKLNLALIERIIDALFVSFFSDDPSQYNDPEFNNGHCYKRDDSLKENDFKDNHCFALFHYIMEYEGAKELYVAEAVKERTKTYLNSNDEFTSVFNSLYEIAWIDEMDHEKGRDMKEVIKLSEVYAAYKEGDVYKNMSKKECRKMTKPRFIEIFSTHINFKHYYSLRIKIGGSTYRNILRGFKRKEECDNDAEEEEEE